MDLTSSYVYIISLEDKSAFKVGVSSSIRKRVKRLSKFYNLDLGHVHLLDCSGDSRAYEIEDLIHKTLKTHRRPIVGEGGTEFFDGSILKECMAIVDSLKSLRGLSLKTVSLLQEDDPYSSFDLSVFGTQLGSVIRRRRLDLNITQEELGRRAGVSRHPIKKIEEGDTTVMVKTVLKLLVLLDINLSLPETPSPTPTRIRSRR